ncbi:hypothetical protein RAS1_33440 [Phycisphaerae bacterium RAS1]|nr:hypothetical protein RAS1_33440 [Phycisphaerae bacterium RAS1]
MRLRYVAGGLCLLLVLLVVFLPAIISIPAVARYCVSTASGDLRGKIEIERIALSWFGPSEVLGVRVADPDGQPVITMQRLATSRGLWGLAISSLVLGDLTIDSPQVTFRIDPAGRLTLAEAFMPKSPAQVEKSTGEAPEMSGKLALRNGAVRFVAASGDAVEVNGIALDVTANTLADMAAKLTGQIDGRTPLAVEAELKNLVRGGRFDVEGAGGRVLVRTDQPVDLQRLAAILPGSGLSGRVTVDVDAGGTPGDVKGRFAIKAVGLSAGAGQAVAPIDLEMSGNGRLAGGVAEADLNLVGQAGTAAARIRCKLAGGAALPDAADLTTAILTGSKLVLPDFDLGATAQLDLAALDRALPGMLDLPADRKLAAGSMTISKLVVHGGVSPALNVAADLKDVSAATDGKSVALSPVTLAADAVFVDGRGLDIRSASFKSSFADATARGVPADLTAEFRADLLKLKAELGRLFDVSALELAGVVAGSARIVRQSETAFGVNANVDATNLRYTHDDKKLDIGKASLKQEGELLLDGGRLSRVASKATKLGVGGELLAQAAGFYDVRGGGFDAEINVSKAELDFIARQAAALGWKELSRYGGFVSIQTKASRGSSADRITTGGTLASKDLTIDGQPVAERDSKLAWSKASFSPDFSSFDAAEVKLDSAPATLSATQVRCGLSKNLALDLKLEGSADLARLSAVAARVAGETEPPQLGGKLTIAANASTVDGNVTLKSSGGIDSFQAGAGEQRFTDKRVQFDLDAGLDAKADRLTIKQSKLVSSPLTVELNGTIDKTKATQVAAIKGKYDADWARITTVLHQLAPSSKGHVAFKGKTSSAIKLDGPLNNAKAKPPIRGATGGLELGWDGVDLFGVALGNAKLAPALKSGQITVPKTEVAAAGGKVRLGGSIDLGETDPTLRLPGATKLIENVPVTNDLCRSVLSFINPIFLALSRVEGRLSLDTRDVTVPLGRSFKTKTSGRGRLVLAKMSIAPDGLLSELLEYGGMPKQEQYGVEVSGCDLTLERGRLAYKDLTLRFSKDFDLRFSGSVGLDETLDLVVSLPAGVGLLKKLGVKGDLSGYVEKLKGTRVELPLVGTRTKPKFDFGRVDVKKLMQGVLEKGAESLIEDVLGDLQKDSKDRK